MLAGSLISAAMLVLKILHPHQNVMDQHGPLFVVGGALIVSGIQLLAIGLLGELQVRHHFTSQHPTPYTIDRMVRLRPPQESNILPRR